TAAPRAEAQAQATGPTLAPADVRGLSARTAERAAAVDRENLAGDRPGPAEKKSHRVDNLLDRDKSLKGNLPPQLLALRFVDAVRREHRSRRDGVDPNLGGELERQAPGEHRQRCLRHAVG